MQRLFVAIEPPPAVRAQLLSLMGGLPHARWQSEDQLHLTVRFIGAVDRHQARDCEAALAGLSHPAFSLQLSGIGTFSRRGEGTTLWVGVKPDAPLHTLFNKVNRALERVGLPPEARAYTPHITLARFSREGPQKLEPFVAGVGGVTSTPFMVDELTLYESRLTSDRAYYQPLERFRLNAVTPPARDSASRCN